MNYNTFSHKEHRASGELGLKQHPQTRLDRLDLNMVHWLAHHSITLLRVGLGVVYVWFGALKFFPGLSPAEGLALHTIAVLTFGWIPAEVSRVLLATLECVIGLGFLTGRSLRLILLLMAFQMVGTLSPLVLFPGEVFQHVPYAPTLEGQYIIKNLVLIGAGLVIGATVRRGRLVADPSSIKESGALRQAEPLPSAQQSLPAEQSTQPPASFAQDPTPTLVLAKGVLTVLSGPSAGMRFEIKRPRLVIGHGSTPSNDQVNIPLLPLDDPLVSRYHLAIRAWPDGVYAYDLGSAHGTWINGRPLGGKPARLEDGAEIQVGPNTLLHFRRS
jgi:pSer/pThr/pTyr-binding forkhead associated (FHA) protein